MSSLPLFLDLQHGHVVVVGANVRALNKLSVLRTLGADVHWFPLSSQIPGHVPEGKGALTVFDGVPRDHDLERALAVIAAESDEIEQRISRAARRLSVPVNAVDRPELSTFTFPAVVVRGDVVVAVGTGGAAPVLARRLRERIEVFLPPRLGEVAAFLSRWRRRLKQTGRASDRQFWEGVIDGPIARKLLEGKEREAETQIESLLAQRESEPAAKSGSVAIVGAGPGDPDLLTLKALRALQDADIVFYDDLVSREILERTRRDAVTAFVGKRKGQPGESQDQINRRLIDAARKGLRVVRLKGGDPFVFGRGGEEVEALRNAGVVVTVVPGVTAALGCAAEALLPLTFRNEARRILVITAHSAGDEPVDWAAGADRHTTVVVYMGLSAASDVRDGLIAAGRSPSTPVAVLARGTMAGSSAVVGTLDQLAQLAARAGDGPAILVVGEAVAHSEPWQREGASALRLVA